MKLQNSYLFNLVASERKPALGPQVIVQMEEEKLLMKQARKEEKKYKEEMRLRNKNKDDSDSESDIRPFEIRNRRYY